MVAKYPAIPEPTIDPASLRDAVLSLKQAFEILTGQRGNPDYAAFTGALPEPPAPVSTLPAGSISVTPAGNIASTNVQAALVELDTEKVAKAGDTMTGHLSLPITPAAANAVRKDYVDTADALKVAKAGDTMTGHLSLPITPAAANAVRKDYVDAAVAAAAGVTTIAGNTGAFTLNGTSGITNTVNDIKLSPASASQFGAVKVDGTTITSAGGVISGVAPADNPWVLLATLTGAGPLQDTTNFTSSYNEYEIVFDLVPVTNAVDLQLQVHSGGSFQATTYLTNTFGTSGSITVAQTSPTTHIKMNTNNTVINAVPGISGSVRVRNVTSTTTPKLWNGQAAFPTGAVLGDAVIGGMWNNNAALTGFRLQFSSGNIASGTAKLYGRV